MRILQWQALHKYGSSLPRYSFYQSALRLKQHEDITPSFRVDSSEKGLMMVMFCSDLPVKRCEGGRAFNFFVVQKQTLLSTFHAKLKS